MRLVAMAAGAGLATGAALAADPVAPADLARHLPEAKTAPLVLDVRTHEEFAGGRVPRAKHIPLAELEERAGELPKDRPIVVYCESGARATRASRVLAARGFTNVREMAGSFAAWREAGLKIEK